VALKYDPLVLTPESVNDAPIYEHVAGEPVLTINQSKGHLRYVAQLSKEVTISSDTLLIVRWRARNPILYSEIEFEKTGTRIGKGEGNILGHRAAGELIGGTLAGGVVVSPLHDSPRMLMPRFADVALEGIDEQVHLRLEAEPETAAADQEWVVSLTLRNDAALPFNNMCVRLLFDPAKLQVVDWHRGNWIRQGINIYDGFAHETYPFEVHRLNRADNERGEILYQVGTRASRLFPSGELAKIRFRTLAPASLADLRFDFQAPQRVDGNILTDVDFLGLSVLRRGQRRVTKAAERAAPESLRRPGT
jgi:hypothetical protein